MSDYKLVPTDLPSRRRGGVYVDMITDFSKMKQTCVRVDYKATPSSIYSGLTAALKRRPELADISVARRGDEIYLAKKGASV
jgi:hypothetical protein